MGIDLIRGGRIANRGVRKTKSSNSYLKSLINVSTLSFSSIPSFPGELMLNSIKSFTKDSTNQDWIDTLSPSPESSSISHMTETHKSKITSLDALLLLLDLSPTMLDSSTFLKDSESQLLSSLQQPETEFKPPREPVSHLTSSLNWHQQEKEFSFWEDQETEKQKDISVLCPVRRDLTQLPMSEPKVVNSREPEAEDDHPILFKLQLLSRWTVKTQRDHLSLSLATWGINDQNYYRDDDNSETAENDELLVGVLLILIGLY